MTAAATAPVRDLATEMAAPKYAHLECERRWRVDQTARPALPPAGAIAIEDRYITGARLRLRHMRGSGGESRKLTKKYAASDAARRPIVTLYLSEAEFALLARLPARILHKRRYTLEHDGRDWSLDVFEGPLAGLELLEIEAPERELDAITAPPWAGREITHDRDWQGGALARLDMLPEESWPAS